MSRTVVFKLGGNLASDREQLTIIARELAQLAADGDRLVVVHGGGPQVSALSRKLGIEPNIVGGRRVTDAATLEVVKYVLAGQMSVDYTVSLAANGLRTVGLSAVSAGLVRAVRRPPRIVSGGGDEPVDFGHVGDIVGVGADLLNNLLNGGFVPVINSVAADEQGRVYNINADIASTRIAAALEADHLVSLTGAVAGVMRDKDDPTSRIPTLTESAARAAIADGTIAGGMIPKVEESLNVLDQGVGTIHIVGSLQPGDIPKMLDEPGIVGTALV